MITINDKRVVSACPRECACKACGRTIKYADACNLVVIQTRRMTHTAHICRSCSRANDLELLRSLIITAQQAIISAPGQTAYLKDMSIQNSAAL